MISVVSGTYNRLEHLKKMVESVRASVDDIPYEIVLVDGGSTDGTIDWCKAQTDVVLIEQGTLLGAIKAFNAGCKIARGTFIALLNDDVNVVGSTLAKAYRFLNAHPEVGQVAFENDVKGTADKYRNRYGYYNGYLYGQCCMTRKLYGDIAGWWGDEGMKTYGGDTRLSLRLYELGYPTVKLEGCMIQDWVVSDALRKRNSDAPRAGGKTHPDLVTFTQHWQGRLAGDGKYTPANPNQVLLKAAYGTLRTLRFKSMMSATDKPRTGMIDAFKEYGPTFQVNSDAALNKHGLQGYQDYVARTIADVEPDLVIFQAQRNTNVLPHTVLALRGTYPNVFFINWDGDTHYPLTPFHFMIAQAVHLQLVVSPSLFEQYRAHGVSVGYWPIAVEQEYIDAARPKRHPVDVSFLGALYGIGTFPEAVARRESVVALARSGMNFELHGYGWEAVRLHATTTTEQHETNASIYGRSKLGLSISQASDLWGYTSDRLYNITATGCPALVQRFAGMEEHGYVDGETCIVWATPKEALEKAKYYIDSSHAAEREEIGKRGREMTLVRHVWPERVKGLFAMLGGYDAIS